MKILRFRASFGVTWDFRDGWVKNARNAIVEQVGMETLVKVLVIIWFVGIERSL